MAEKAKTPGFPQKYNEEPSAKPQDLNPDAVVDLVTPQEASRAARASAKPAPAKPARAARKPRAKK